MFGGLNITGQRFGKLTAVGVTYHRGRREWSCLCDCGKTTFVPTGVLKAGRSKSCGCLRHELRARKTHGCSNNRTYITHQNMIQRCTNPEHPKYKDYGGRGIKVCARWGKFSNFLEDMGDRPQGMTIERVDNDGDYAPSNCRWATDMEQSRNKRTNRRIEYNGETMILADWARRLNIEVSLLSRRIQRTSVDAVFSVLLNQSSERK